MVKGLAVASLLLSVASITEAAPPDVSTGRFFVDVCNSKLVDKLAVCMVYVKGVTDGLNLQAATSKTQLPYCFGKPVPIAALAVEYGKYLKAIPSSLDRPAENLLLHFLTSTFPCTSS